MKIGWRDPRDMPPEERREYNERRAYARLRADALLAVDMPVFYRRSPIGGDPPKSSESPRETRKFCISASDQLRWLR